MGFLSAGRLAQTSTTVLPESDRTHVSTRENGSSHGRTHQDPLLELGGKDRLSGPSLARDQEHAFVLVLEKARDPVDEQDLGVVAVRADVDSILEVLPEQTG
eukprot:1648457-Rhodomonas_salina.2